ncbi:MAG: GNAT family N-acetyltransferase [Streptococcaceae bacterium]|nr:GNAT family N-acetyltransferase [Streptococcaceae bacterium]
MMKHEKQDLSALTEKLMIENVNLSVLTEVMMIETTGFSVEEAATEAAMYERIEKLQDTFLVAKTESGKVAGFIVACASNVRYITDELFENVRKNEGTDDYLLVLSLAVLPEFQHQGIAGKLLLALENVAKKQQRKAISLTCLAEKIGFYEVNGYRNEGVSTSSHAHEVWYNLVLELAY